MELINALIQERATDYVAGAAKKVGDKAKGAAEKVKKSVGDAIEAGHKASFDKDIDRAVRSLVALVKERIGTLKESAADETEDRIDEAADAIINLAYGGEPLSEGTLDFIKGAAGAVGRKVKDKIRSAKATMDDIHQAGLKASQEGDDHRANVKAETSRKKLDAKIAAAAQRVNKLLRGRVKTSGKKFKASDIAAYIDAAAGDDKAVASKTKAALRAA